MDIPQATIELLAQQTKYEYSLKFLTVSTPHDPNALHPGIVITSEISTKVPRREWRGRSPGESQRTTCIGHILWFPNHCILSDLPIRYYYHDPEYPQNLINSINNL